MNFKKRNILIFFILIAQIISISASSLRDKRNTLYIFGKNNNSDIIDIVKKQNKVKLYPYSAIEKILENTNEGDGILILAENYPEKQVEISKDVYQKILGKKLRAYIEYPSYVPGFTFGEINKPSKKRAVISSNFFQNNPDSLSILGINGLHYISSETNINSSFIVAATVAGFDSAIYGLPEKTDPLLFELPNSHILVSTTCLSNFVSGRYAPQQAWGAIWKCILEYVLPNKEIKELEWNPEVTVTYLKEEKLPRNFLKKSIINGIEWYSNAKMLIADSFADSLQYLIDSGTERIKWSKDIALGNGSKGSLECVFSEINENGSQPLGIIVRGDCVSETAMAFATSGAVLNDKESFKIAQNLMDFYLFNSIATKNEYGDPQHGAYGLIPWGISNQNWYKASYGDDNARFILASITTSAILKTDRWNEKLMRSLLALLRTTGKNGFRSDRIDLPGFAENGWKYYNEWDIINLSPHFEAYLWACFLWAYNQTGDEQFLEKAEKGISILMKNYPDKLIWTNGLAQEKVRMLLPLSWLVQVRNTTENRNMLLTVVNDILKLQDKCGAIREELGRTEMGKYPPPQSNEAYGTNEASLIAQNGDPVSDLLYTTNFAFLGLHEASYVLDDPKVEEAVDRLTEFLCRIQVKSEKHPEIHGGWMRAFDYEKFEHWGSNADAGWGAWAIESGWTQGWITSILSLREMNTSIWKLTEKSDISKYYTTLKSEMLINK
ncbi:MAG: hypothetical protein VB024_04200 [Dysgonamonadaceae bacterium]|nr:hypothetical protein [Dysgonamonadaceae bacterium]